MNVKVKNRVRISISDRDMIVIERETWLQWVACRGGLIGPRG